jgi:hypothetical protein
VVIKIRKTYLFNKNLSERKIKREAKYNEKSEIQTKRTRKANKYHGNEKSQVDKIFQSFGTKSRCGKETPHKN